MTIYVQPLRPRSILSPGSRVQSMRSVAGYRPRYFPNSPFTKYSSPTQSYSSAQSEPTTMSSPQAQTLHLPDGRTLGYAEYGSPNGTPLLYFHGFPSSRLEAYTLDSMAARHNVCLLALDRPGFGLSTHDPQRRIMDWPTDVQAFATQLGLSQFVVLGVSGGGPYALACAKGLPQTMLAAVGVLAGAPVWDDGYRTEGVPWYARLLYMAANYWPSGTRVISYALVEAIHWLMKSGPVKRRIDEWLEATRRSEMAKKKKTDGEEGEENEVLRTTAQRRESLMSLLFEGFAQGTAGFVHETQLLTRDWGFPFEDVTYDEVQMWHGSRDANAPLRTIRIMAKRMPHCVLTEYDDTHFSIGKHFEEIIFQQLIPFPDELEGIATKKRYQTQGAGQ